MCFDKLTYAHILYTTVHFLSLLHVSAITVVYTMCAYVGFVDYTHILIAWNEQH